MWLCYIFTTTTQSSLNSFKEITGKEIIITYKKVHDELTSSGFKLATYFTENKYSEAPKMFDRQQPVELQLVLSHMHRRNAAEEEIHMWKNHFIEGLYVVGKMSPMHLWCHLLKQAQITLNLFRTARSYPKKSAQVALEGNFDFNKTPLVPPVTKVVMHKKSGQQKS